MEDQRKRIAVVGGGVAGITACQILERCHDVTLFEKNSYVGGHTNTVVIEKGPDAGTAVDTGFIVCNDRTYPLFHELLSQLNVKVRNSDMSFGYYCRNTEFFYAGTDLGGLFAQRKNILSPRLWAILYGILKFARCGQSQIDASHSVDATLGEFITANGFSDIFVDDYLYPMGSAIWSAPREDLALFPAKAFLAFFKNHGLLSLIDRPQWQTVVGGSHSYVRSFLSSCKTKVSINQPVRTIERKENHVQLRFDEDRSEVFDSVVLALHADEALSLLADPSKEEEQLLGAWEYAANSTILHTDISVLPPNKNAWASWNYTREKDSQEGQPATVSYYMNLLQGLDTKEHYCVTLNPKQLPKENSIIKEFSYSHPQYSSKAINSQGGFAAIQGARQTYYCGSYHGHGFHEDAVSSAVNVAKYFGLEFTPQR